MKLLRILSVSILVIAVVSQSAVYLYRHSFTGQLHQYGFSPADILLEEREPIMGKPDTRVILLASRDRIGVVGLNRTPLGLWKESGVFSTYVLEVSTEHSYALSDLVQPGVGGENRPAMRIHYYFGLPLPADSPRPVMKRTELYDLQTRYFDWNGKTLLFVHAIQDSSRRPSSGRFTSDEVYQSIVAQLAEAAK